MKVEFIVFDTETNGINNCSVLSIACIKLSYDFEKKSLEKIDDYYKFYYRNPKENINFSALKVNGLYDNVIEEKRSNVTYPLYFLNDIENLKKFIGKCNHFIAHNIKFDKQFIPFQLKNQFCTMIENVDILNIKNGKSNKWPKLNELAIFYKVPYNENNLHDSYYDTLILARIIFRMIQNPISKNNIISFLKKN